MNDRTLHGKDMLTDKGRAEWERHNIQISALAHSPYKADFPLLANRLDLAFLDSAATTQRPSVVLDAHREFYETMNANALRGLYQLSIKATEAIGASRAKTASFLGLDEKKDARDIIFCRNASEGFNLLAYGLGSTLLHKGDEVCITVMEHHSNLIPWQQVCRLTGSKLVYMYPNDKGVIDEEEMKAKIGPRTKIVSAIHVSNVLGTRNDIARMAEYAHQHRALMIVDGAQSVPHFPIRIDELGCDFFVFSSHKILGPMGIGIVWGRHEILEDMPPFLTGGEMIDSVTEQDATWAGVPEKFEAGTQDAAGIHAHAAALDYVTNIGYETLQAREKALMIQLIRRLKELEFVRLIGPDDPDAHYGVVSFNVCAIHPHDVASILDMDGVAIRAGHHCAQPLLKHLGIDACCRASLAFYNDTSDIDRLIKGLHHVWRMFH